MTNTSEEIHLLPQGFEFTYCGKSIVEYTRIGYSADTKHVTCPVCLKNEQSRASLQEGSQDLINHPSHYSALPNGIECIEISQFFNFNLGNAIKYIWRAGKKTTDPTEDLQKAMKYLEFETERVKKHGSQS